MDPHTFIRLAIGSLGLRVPGSALNSSKAGIHVLSSPCSSEIRLRGFPVRTTSIPLVASLEATPDIHNIASSFYLEDSEVKALLTPGCFGPKWGEGKPVILFNRWIDIVKNKHGSRKPGAELHLRVQLDPDPRYIFKFEDVTTLSPQIVQLQGSIKQPTFSCEFSRDKVAKVGPLGRYWIGSGDGSDIETERRENKGWKVKIHDLSGSAVLAAFITTALCHQQVVIGLPILVDCSSRYLQAGELAALRKA